MNYGYFWAAVFIAAGITFALRLFPVLFRQSLGQSQALHTFSQWLPLGAMVALGAYGIVSSPALSTDISAIPYLVAIAVTVGLHLWRRNIFLSLLSGTVTCVVLSSALL